MKRIRFGLQGKFTISLALTMFAIGLVITRIVATQYRSRMESFYTDTAFNVATYASKLLDADKIREYYRTGKKDDYYEKARMLLLRAKQSMNVKYFYVVVPEEKEMVYVWDAGEPGEEGVCNLLDRDEYYGDGCRVMHQAFSPDAKRVILVTRNETYGYLASAYVPILDKKGVPVALASVDVSMDMIDEQINSMIMTSTLSLFAAMLICVVAYFVIMRKMVIIPVNSLATIARNFTAGDAIGADGRLKQIGIKSQDEIGDLYRAMVKMNGDLAYYMANLKSVTAERERVGAELNIARQIQLDMLPGIGTAFPDRHDFDIYATMTPAKEIGGDFYDFFLIDDSHLALVIADVSGKGVPAALFMAIAKTSIKNRTLAGGTPSQILHDVNNQLCDGNIAQLFVTVWMAIIDLSTGDGVAANAGHEHPALKRAGGKFELVEYRHSPVVAALEDLNFSEHVFSMRPGDTLLVYTDGVAEATNAQDELFGCDRMLKSLNSDGAASLQGLLQGLKRDIDGFVGAAPQFDDITMLAFRYNG